MDLCILLSYTTAELSRVFDVSEWEQGVLRANPHPLSEAGNNISNVQETIFSKLSQRGFMLLNLLTTSCHKIYKTHLIRFYALYLCQTSNIEIFIYN